MCSYSSVMFSEAVFKKSTVWFYSQNSCYKKNQFKDANFQSFYLFYVYSLSYVFMPADVQNLCSIHMGHERPKINNVSVNCILMSKPVTLTNYCDIFSLSVKGTNIMKLITRVSNELVSSLAKENGFGFLHFFD